MRATADIPLSFSVTLETADAKAYTLALIGTDQTIVVGEDYDNNKMLYGVTDTLSDSVVYGFGSWSSAGYTKLDTEDITTTSVDKATATPITISGVSSFDSGSNTYSLTLTFGASSYTITGLVNLNVTALSFSGDGTNGTTEPPKTNVTFSALSLTGATPEAATATLSLLALAGPVARRRRH